MITGVRTLKPPVKASNHKTTKGDQVCHTVTTLNILESMDERFRKRNQTLGTLLSNAENFLFCRIEDSS